MLLTPALAAIAILLLAGACAGSEPEARNVESVVDAFEAEGLPTLIALNRDADAAPTTGSSTSGSPEGTRESLIQLFSHGQPEYVRGLAYSDDPEMGNPPTRSSGRRWMIYVLDSEQRADGFDIGTRSSLPAPEFVRVQRDNVVVLSTKQFLPQVERALERIE